MPAAKVGHPAPDFRLDCISVTDRHPQSISLQDYAGRWLMLIFYPRDFSFVCPTELTAFSARLPDFHHRNCDLLGISVDSIDLHREWLTTPPADGGLGPLQFPLASDSEGSVARPYGVWVEEKQVSTRGLFIIDPEGVLQYAVLHNLSVGRSPEEVLRVLNALQTGGLCPASWTMADGTIDPEKALKPGRVLGHYRIRRRVGGGSSGTVFAALDLRLERLVALKVLNRNVFESREAVLAESRTAARLNHPNICTVYAVEEEDGLPVIAMEFLDGRPLSDVITEGLSSDQTQSLALQIASGLAAAHAQNVVHGDLKPANIIITSDTIARIVDFGLARPEHHEEGSAHADSPALPDSTAAIADTVSISADADATMEWNSPDDANTSSIRGTPAYMAPEQAMGQTPTTASDVFSYGLTLFEMSTGRAPHRGRSVVDLLMKLQHANMADDLVEQVDEAYRPLLASTFAHAPQDRPSMQEVLDRLGNV
jgi:alkyl hydroperoxide reductase subunit AhpC/tRNA A-37 threonylcarbamoyl transferase component Bud32